MEKNNHLKETKMRISFDLDEVLFVSPNTHKTEPVLPFPFRLIYKERLRLGTPKLIHTLQERGYEVWVYTSSFRSINYIKGLFKKYHIKFTDIINGERHMKEVQHKGCENMPSKFPPKYRIALHIDDEDSVVANGKVYGFKVFQLNEQDDDWVDKILARAEEVYRFEKANHSL